VGRSDGPIATTVKLPAAVRGRSVRLRWREVTDRSRASVGASIDDVRVTVAAPQANPGVDRPFNGTPGDDDIRLTDAPDARVQLWVNHQLAGTFARDDRFILHGLAGHDTIVNESAAANVLFFGDDGADTLIGGAGDDVLVGGAGDDR